MTRFEAETWFRGYGLAFDSFDADEIADHLYLPCTIIGSDYVVVLNTRPEVVANFEAVLGVHRSLGYHHADLEECEVEPLSGGLLVEARTTWAFFKSEASLIDRFQMIYFLTKIDGGWKIAVAVNAGGSNRAAG